MTDPQALLTLHDAAKLIPGADAATLKRLARRGKLVTYRPGKAYLTTAADVQEAIQACRVVPKVRDCGFVRPVQTAPPPLGLSSMDLASAGLAAARATLRARKKH